MIVAAATDCTRHRRLGRIGPRPIEYERRKPEHSVLFRVIQEHLETFLAAAADESVGVPKFVEKELRAFLACGVLAHGFARFRCCDCSFERLVALAADLTERVIPFVPVRQFVLSVPHRVRYLLAYDHDRCIAVLRIFIRALMSFYRKRARKRRSRWSQRFGHLPGKRTVVDLPWRTDSRNLPKNSCLRGL